MKPITTTENLKKLFDQETNFEDFTFKFYMIWCDTVTVNSREFQQVLANSKIANWFITELTKNEKEYQYLILNYKNMDISDRTELYIRCIFKLFSIFPKPLLEEAKKREVQTQTTKVAGVKIEYSIVNQN